MIEKSEENGENERNLSRIRSIANKRRSLEDKSAEVQCQIRTTIQSLHSALQFREIQLLRQVEALHQQQQSLTQHSCAIPPQLAFLHDDYMALQHSINQFGRIDLLGANPTTLRDLEPCRIAEYIEASQDHMCFDKFLMGELNTNGEDVNIGAQGDGRQEYTNKCIPSKENNVPQEEFKERRLTEEQRKCKDEKNPVKSKANIKENMKWMQEDAMKVDEIGKKNVQQNIKLVEEVMGDNDTYDETNVNSREEDVTNEKKSMIRGEKSRPVQGEYEKVEVITKDVVSDNNDTDKENIRKTELMGDISGDYGLGKETKDRKLTNDEEINKKVSEDNNYINLTNMKEATSTQKNEGKGINIVKKENFNINITIEEIDKKEEADKEEKEENISPREKEKGHPEQVQRWLQDILLETEIEPTIHEVERLPKIRKGCLYGRLGVQS